MAHNPATGSVSLLRHVRGQNEAATASRKRADGALREAREYAAAPLPAQTARRTTLKALIALEFRGLPVHDPVHAGALSCYVP